MELEQFIFQLISSLFPTDFQNFLWFPTSLIMPNNIDFMTYGARTVYFPTDFQLISSLFPTDFPNFIWFPASLIMPKEIN